MKGSLSVMVKCYGSDFKGVLIMLRHKNTLCVTKAAHLQQIKYKMRNEHF